MTPIFVTDPELLSRRVAEPDMSDLLDPDFSPAHWLRNPNNEAVTDGENFMLFSQTEPGIWEGHWLLRARGKGSFVIAADLLRYHFVRSGAELIYGWVPAHKRASKWFTRQMGFKSGGEKNRGQGLEEFFSISRRSFEARYGLSEI